MENNELHRQLIVLLLTQRPAEDNAAAVDALLADSDVVALLDMLIRRAEKYAALPHSAAVPPEHAAVQPPPENPDIVSSTHRHIWLPLAFSAEILKTRHPWLPLAFGALRLKTTESQDPVAVSLPDPPSLPLRPGHIPIAAPIPADVLQTPLPKAKISLPNARVGTPFHAAIDIRLDNGDSVTVEAVTFPEDIGLSFDLSSGVLAGTPTASGDIPLTVSWRWRDRPSVTQQQLFIINPDPRSLWKIIDPPENDRYFKPNIDHGQIMSDGVRIAAASRRGRSHEHVGSFRDDDFYIHHCTDSGWSIMLVADGAGSAKNSRRGSQIVTRCMGEHFRALLSGEAGKALREQVENWHSADQQTVGATFIRQFHQASLAAVNAITREAQQSGDSVKSYSTTLLATVSLRCGSELFAAAFWLGDGAIAACGPVGKVRVLGTPDSGEYAGQTRFLDKDALADPEFSKRVIIGKWPQISHLVLMTDGVSDPWFETDNGLRNADLWDTLIADIAPVLADESHVSAQLATWLNFFSPGNHDDRTIVVSW